MGTKDRTRCGFTLIEIIVALAILAVLIGFLLVAVQKVREAAVLTHNRNGIRQIILGVHQLADQGGGRIDNLTRSSMAGVTVANSELSLFTRLTPILHGPRVYNEHMTHEEILDFGSPNVAVYRNPSDPSWDYDPAFTGIRGRCSYALNMSAADGVINLVAGYPDGTSQTVAFVDKYAVKGSPDSRVSQTVNLYTQLFDPYNGEVYGDRRATFADRGWQDVLPVTDRDSATTRPSVAGKTFQVRPRPEDVDPSIPQTPHAAGLAVAFFDGSVRVLSPSIRDSVFWALVTPAGGEVVSLD